MILYFRLLKESFGFAWSALRNNKLRTFLSLLGVTIGIFSIIAVLAAVDSLDQKINKELSSLDKNTIYLLKFPFGPSDIPQWKREQFPNIKYDEFLYMKSVMTHTDEIAYQIFVGPEQLKSEFGSTKGTTIYPVSFDFLGIQNFEFEQGRFFTEAESNAGAKVAVLGTTIAQTLFPNNNCIGKSIRMYGKRVTVIGLLKKQGASFFGDSDDNSVYIPANFARQIYGDNNKTATNVLVFKPEKNIDMEAYKAEISQKLRNYRGIKAGEIDNFFINVFSGFTNLIDSIIGQMNLVGWVISGFSLLVGGFGIANIMFVSVKERTNLIGIQKSLGAKNRFILLQFLFEAIILSLFGGIIGLFLVWIIAFGLSKAIDFEFVLSLKNILLGSGLAGFIGLISGILPAISAARLDPVEAIRTGM